ncbi:hypothetical protein SAMN05216246_102218 [Actinomyces denticolens]|uniref:Uncharacterized protein n=1 Tax=Actinomyces denticolens TaxID=52767 RepID=A0ABY1I2K7_9ACTO|nr:hypothetical protein SAMN05216246_102218 [Actinomyces denticolens]SUU09092.1 Uncharacterised protein [Actinomyces denticolens]
MRDSAVPGSPLPTPTSRRAASSASATSPAGRRDAARLGSCRALGRRPSAIRDHHRRHPKDQGAGGRQPRAEEGQRDRAQGERACPPRRVPGLPVADLVGFTRGQQGARGPRRFCRVLTEPGPPGPPHPSTWPRRPLSPSQREGACGTRASMSVSRRRKRPMPRAAHEDPQPDGRRVRAGRCAPPGPPDAPRPPWTYCAATPAASAPNGRWVVDVRPRSAPGPGSWCAAFVTGPGAPGRWSAGRGPP